MIFEPGVAPGEVADVMVCEGTVACFGRGGDPSEGIWVEPRGINTLERRVGGNRAVGGSCTIGDGRTLNGRIGKRSIDDIRTIEGSCTLGGARTLNGIRTIHDSRAVGVDGGSGNGHGSGHC